MKQQDHTNNNVASTTTSLSEKLKTFKYADNN